jgi:hypothetical protein
MSKKNTKKHFEKRKAREKAVKKKIAESRVFIRKERRFEREREEALEREFAQKQNYGLSEEEVKQKIADSWKMLEAINEHHDAEDYKKAAVLQELKEQLEKAQKLVDAKAARTEEKKPENQEEPKNLDAPVE